MKLTLLLPFLLWVCASQAQTLSASELSSIKNLIEESNTRYFTAIAKNDVDALGSQFLEESWIMVPGAPVYCGPQAITDYFNENLLKKQVAIGKAITIDLYATAPDMVAEIGFYQLYDKNNERSDDGKFLVIWKKVDGQWKRLRQTTSSSVEQSKSDNKRMEEARKAIAESNAIYFQAFVKNDPSIFAERYAEDACIMAPFAPQQCGRDNVLKFFKDAYNDYGMRNGKFITTAIYGDATEYVTEEGLWQSFNANGELFDDGKFLVLWKKTEKGWKMFRDSFSSNRNPK